MKLLKEAKETKAWLAYQRYQKFLDSANFFNVIRENRRFCRGDQYDEGMDPSIPKPMMNICFEYIEKVSAKLLDTPYAVEFNTDSDEDLHKLDEYYRFNMEQINDRDTLVDVCKAGLRDGVGCAFTIHDEDTYGIHGLYRGCEIRKYIPIEDVFFANPYCDDPQRQEYLGYVMKISVDEAKRLCENKECEDLIVPDRWDMTKEYSPENIAFDTCTLITRFFRDEKGEVCFECATQYCDLYKKPHYLNPSRNDEKNWTEDEKKQDYKSMAPEKADIQAPLRKESASEYNERMGKFNRYPFSWFRPYPIPNTVLGESVLKQLIPNQKQSNFINMMAMLNFQNHSMGKWAVQDEALADGQVIDNDPSQVIRVKARFNQPISSLVHRFEPSNTSGEQINQGAMVASESRQVFGFNNLTSEGNMNDVSGFALQQAQKQQNLVLQIPQERLWNYIRDNAKTDLLFFKFYIDEAKYFVKLSEGEIFNEENYRQMAQQVIQAKASMGNQGVADIAKANGGSLELPKVKRVREETIKNSEFLHDFDVSVTVIQGVAGSQISESQHYTQVMQFVMSGNAPAEMVMAWIQCDPAFSPKVKANLKNMLEAVQNGQLAQKDAEIEQLRGYVRDLMNNLKSIGQQVDYQNQQLEAYKKAVKENARLNQTLMQASQERSSQPLTEGEVKSNNSRGVEGTSFDTYSM